MSIDATSESIASLISPSSVAVTASATATATATATSIAVSVLDDALSQEPKEFHFHTYYFQCNPQSETLARELRAKVVALVEQGYFKVVPQAWRGGINTIPMGPHTVGSFEVWCPMEHFARCFAFFALNHGPLSTLIHPLTKQEIVDHTQRAVWLGQPVPLDFTILRETLPKVPLQYPELRLGYSAPE